MQSAPLKSTHQYAPSGQVNMSITCVSSSMDGIETTLDEASSARRKSAPRLSCSDIVRSQVQPTVADVQRGEYWNGGHRKGVRYSEYRLITDNRTGYQSPMTDTAIR